MPKKETAPINLVPISLAPKNLASNAPLPTCLPSHSQKTSANACYPLIDTHTHFDMPVFDDNRQQHIEQAKRVGVRHLLLIGYVKRYFERMFNVQQQINQTAIDTSVDAIKSEKSEFKAVEVAAAQPNLAKAGSIDAPHDTVIKNMANNRLQAHTAIGLHPVYITEHKDSHLQTMHELLTQRDDIIAIGEIGLDTYTAELKKIDIYAKQQQFFKQQLDLAVTHQLPVLLHIRKAHADALNILKHHDYDAHKLGGIAHSFSGGVQEAKAFVKLGFKLGVTGQVTNPNAKKLRQALMAAVAHYGLECLVIETDCPDMMPMQCQPESLQAKHLQVGQAQVAHIAHNVPANLPFVLATLSELFATPADILAKQLWQNSCEALKVAWQYE